MNIKKLIKSILTEIHSESSNLNFIRSIYERLESHEFKLHQYNSLMYCEIYFFNYATIQVHIDPHTMDGKIQVFYDSEILNNIKSREYSIKIDPKSQKSIDRFIDLAVSAKKYLKDSDAIYGGIQDI